MILSVVHCRGVAAPRITAEESIAQTAGLQNLSEEEEALHLLVLLLVQVVDELSQEFGAGRATKKKKKLLKNIVSKRLTYSLHGVNKKQATTSVVRQLRSSSVPTAPGLYPPYSLKTSPA